MATVTHAGVTWDTSGGVETVIATPALNDLIVIFAGTTGIAGGTVSCSDNNSGGAGTYVQVGSDVTNGVNIGTLSVYVRTALIGSATSTTFTATNTSSTGGGLSVWRIGGMTLSGSSAVRGSGAQNNQAAGGTPAPVLSLTPLSTNPVLGAVQNGNNPAALTPRTGYTEGADNGYASPTQGLHTMAIASGETSATITWGSVSATTAWGSFALELDASGGAVTLPPSGLNLAVINAVNRSRYY